MRRTGAVYDRVNDEARKKCGSGRIMLCMTAKREDGTNYRLLVLRPDNAFTGCGSVIVNCTPPDGHVPVR
jgi:hypothetical protein